MSAPPKDPPRPPGTMLGGYTLEAEVGRGGMGSVYRAVSPEGETVALKLLASHLVGNIVQTQRFRQEYRLAARIQHPNLVKAMDLGEDGNALFFAMEFIDGDSVGALLKRNGHFPEDEALRICAEVADALEAAHAAGMIHRDVKPDNIMVCHDGRVKVADMGLAKDTFGDDLGLTKTGRGLGTPHFMAPEQFKEAKNADPRCDVYSLGATLYMMVTGHLPFRANNPLDAYKKKSENDYTPPTDHTPDLSASVAKAIQKAMDGDPARRPQSMREYARLLRSAGGGAPAELWYVIYSDAEGARRKVKGTEELVVQYIRQGRIGADATGARSKSGPFGSLRLDPLFKEHFAEAAILKATKAPTKPVAAKATVPTVAEHTAAAFAPPQRLAPRSIAPTFDGPAANRRWWIAGAAAMAIAAGGYFLWRSFK